MIHARALALASLSLSLLACGGSDAADGSGGGGTGTGTGTGETTGGEERPASCVDKAADFFNAALFDFDGVEISCPEAAGFVRRRELEGVIRGTEVVESRILRWRVEGCIGSNVCVPSTYYLVTTTGETRLDVEPPVGTFVRIVIRAQSLVGGGCTGQVLATNLPSFGGVPNPMGTDERIWLGGALDKDLGEALVEIAPAPVAECGFFREGCGYVTQMSLAEADPGPESSEVLVRQGEATFWDVPPPSSFAGRYEVRNLDSSYCTEEPTSLVQFRSPL